VFSRARNQSNSTPHFVSQNCGFAHASLLKRRQTEREGDVYSILYNDQQMHNYFTNYHTATCFETIASSSDSCNPIPCQVTQVFQTQLLVIQFTIKMFRTGQFFVLKIL